MIEGISQLSNVLYEMTIIESIFLVYICTHMWRTFQLPKYILSVAEINNKI